MRLKVTLIFILSILIPTALLAYFGLQAVQSEKRIFENSIRQRYESMADVIENEIDTALAALSKEFLRNKRVTESIIIDQLSVFKDQAAISDLSGNPLGGADSRDRGKLMISRRMRSGPYIISVYERYPLVLERYEARSKALYAYVAIIGMSVVAILGGALFTLSALSRQWRLAELKSEFVSGLSHDLRRPLTSIRMFSEMLKDNLVPTEEKRREYYNVINIESERLTQLANNILDFSRIESGRKDHKFKTEDIGKLVKETTDYFLSYNLDDDHPVKVFIAAGLPAIKIETSAVSQAILNLLSNAVKYSPQSKEIKVNAYRSASHVVIEVIDEGIGIPRKEHKKIFRKFYRVREDTSEVEGSGLGLALVKYAAEIHGGRITVESEVGKGSKFTLVLPV